MLATSQHLYNAVSSEIGSLAYIGARVMTLTESSASYAEVKNRLPGPNMLLITVNTVALPQTWGKDKCSGRRLQRETGPLELQECDVAETRLPQSFFTVDRSGLYQGEIVVPQDPRSIWSLHDIRSASTAETGGGSALLARLEIQHYVDWLPLISEYIC